MAVSAGDGVAAWGIVVAARGLTAANAGLWHALEALMAGRSVALCVVDTGVSTALRRRVRAMAASTWLGMDAAEFSWPQAARAAVGTLRADRLLLLHDDVALPPGSDWLSAMAACLAMPGVGVVAPRLVGDCPNPEQAACAPLPYWHTSEFISSAAYAMRAALWPDLAPPLAMDGYDFWGPSAQKAAIARGLTTVICGGATVGHAGGQTYTDVAARAAGYRRNVEAYGATHGVWPEYGMRPSEVRLAPPVGASLAAVVAGEMGAFLAEACPEDERVVVDTAPCAANLRALERAGAPFRYAPWVGGDAGTQALGQCGGRRARLIDYRQSPPRVAAGNRVRAGASYDLLARMREWHLGFVYGVGMGDMLMFTPAMAAFRRRWPEVPIIAHVRASMRALYEHNPDVARVVAHDGASTLPMCVTHLGAVTGWEGTIRSAFGFLDVAGDDGDRRLRYFTRESELAGMAARLAAAGVTGDRPLYTVQTHGGWRSKFWTHAPAFVSALLATGADVVTVGSEAGRAPALAAHPRLRRWDGDLDLAAMFALLVLADGHVGMDSGPSFGAVAVGCPLVALMGPHDPRFLVGDTGAPNVVCIRRHTPAMCHATHGRSCRSGEGVTGGSYCPLRQGPGGDCLDAITPADVLTELQALPRWATAMHARRQTAREETPQ